jgi:hypothetical protein
MTFSRASNELESAVRIIGQNGDDDVTLINVERMNFLILISSEHSASGGC